jgi:hypothetical protein
VNEDATTTLREDPEVEGVISYPTGALSFPRTTSANDPDGEAPNMRLEADDLPFDDDGMKRSQSGRSSQRLWRA